MATGRSTTAETAVDRPSTAPSTAAASASVGAVGTARLRSVPTRRSAWSTCDRSQVERSPSPNVAAATAVAISTMAVPWCGRRAACWTDSGSTRAGERRASREAARNSSGTSRTATSVRGDQADDRREGEGDVPAAGGRVRLAAQLPPREDGHRQGRHEQGHVGAGPGQRPAAPGGRGRGARVERGQDQHRGEHQGAAEHGQHQPAGHGRRLGQPGRRSVPQVGEPECTRAAAGSASTAATKASSTASNPAATSCCRGLAPNATSSTRSSSRTAATSRPASRSAAARARRRAAPPRARSSGRRRAGPRCGPGWRQLGRSPG